MKHSELKQILKLCQSFNVKSLKTDGFLIEFHEKPQKAVGIPESIKVTQQVKPVEMTAKELAEVFKEQMPSDSEMLFYSSEQFEDQKAKEGAMQ